MTDAPNSRESIGSDSKVKLHFSICLSNGGEPGQKIDGTKPAQPGIFRMGDGSLLPGFEAVLLGLCTGDRRQFLIPAEQGFGAHNPLNVRSLPRQKFPRDIDLEPGLMVSFEGPGGELPGVVESISDETVTVDFNHPLAGRDVVFEVEILDVV